MGAQVLLGAVGLATSMVYLNLYGHIRSWERSIEALFLILSGGLPMIAVELVNQMFMTKNTGQSMQGLDAQVFSAILWGATLRSIGLIVTTATIFFVYWLLPMYHSSLMDGVFGIDDRPFTDEEQKREKDGEVVRDPQSHPYYYNFFRIGGLLLQNCGGLGNLLVLIVTYTLATECYLRNPRDGNRLVGEFVVGLFYPSAQEGAAEMVGLAMHAREYIVRCFFSPLMFCSLCNNLPQLHYRGFPNFMTFFYFSQNVIFSFDLTFAGIGYMLPAAHVLRSEFLSVESTALGWVVAIACYDPFFQLVQEQFLPYSDNIPWNEWFDAMNSYQRADHWISFKIWGVAILLLQVMFALCTMSYGLQYSNLSYRTVITTGPYYVFRHPAYVAKLVSFAMLHVPWVDLSKGSRAGKYQNVRGCLTLLALTGLYCVRAFTEERHLMSVSEEYRTYKNAMDTRWKEMGWPF